MAVTSQEYHYSDECFFIGTISTTMLILLLYLVDEYTSFVLMTILLVVLAILNVLCLIYIGYYDTKQSIMFEMIHLTCLCIVCAVLFVYSEQVPHEYVSFLSAVWLCMMVFGSIVGSWITWLRHQRVQA
eukprot:445506_1